MDFSDNDLTPKQKKRKRLSKIKRGSGKKKYFSRNEEQAIEDFINANTREEKEAIFNKYLYDGFLQIIEGIVGIFRVGYLDEIEDLKMDCLEKMYSALDKFDLTKRTKGFSYFSVVAKNYFLYNLQKLKREKSIFLRPREDKGGLDIFSYDSDEDYLIPSNDVFVEKYSDLIYEEYVEGLVEGAEKVIGEDMVNFLEPYFYFQNKQEIVNGLRRYLDRLRPNTNIWNVLGAIIFLVENHRDFSDFSRREIIHAISEKTELSEQKVKNSITVLKYKIKKGLKDFF